MTGSLSAEPDPRSPNGDGFVPLPAHLGRTCVGLAALLGVLSAPGAARAAGSCGSGGMTGDRAPVDFQGSLYYVTTPASYTDAQPWPLIIGLHGDEGDPADSVNWFWRDVADDRFVFVAPKAPNASGSWYEERESNSVWMDALVDQLLSSYNVDLDRIYIWGLSGGAVFISSYAIERQDVFAAVEFNMGGSSRWSYEPPADCLIPARFVVSPTDNLRENALALFDDLTAAGHETTWVDGNCEGHCWDDVEAGVNARDWLLARTHCGTTPSGGCEGGGGTGGGGGSSGSGGTGGTSGSSSGGAAGSGGGATGGETPGSGGTSTSGGATSTGGATPASGGSPADSGGAPTSGGTPPASGGAPASGGTPLAGGAAPDSGGSPVAGGQSSTGGAATGTGAVAPSGGVAGATADDATASGDEEGCGCRVAGARRADVHSPFAALTMLSLLAVARRRRRDVVRR